VDARIGVAEDLPFASGEFDAALASLVVGFMDEPAHGSAEMARVTKPGGTVATCFWDLQRMPALGIFWTAAATVDSAVTGERRRPGGAPGELADLLRAAGLIDVREDELHAEAEYAGFEDWWSAYTLGVGPIGAYYGSLDEPARAELRAECVRLLGHPDGPFTLRATAWFAAGTVPA